jgi:hypothetical protein
VVAGSPLSLALGSLGKPPQVRCRRNQWNGAIFISAEKSGGRQEPLRPERALLSLPPSSCSDSPGSGCVVSRGPELGFLVLNCDLGDV